MKYIYYLCLTVLFLSGCEKNLLNTVPNDRISTDIFWKTNQDAVLGANAVYVSLEGTNIFTWDGLSDLGHTNRAFVSDANIEQGLYDATTDRIYNEWRNAYAGIYAANTFFANVVNVKATDTAQITRLKAEVSVLRAYQYIHLVMLYGDVPIVTGLIDISQAKTLTRTPAAAVWDFIRDELSRAANNLPLFQTDKGRITKGAALALKTRAMLYAGRYQDALDAAIQVMNLGVYSLYPAYKNLFSYAAENNVEVILDKQFLQGSYPNNVFNLMAPYSQKTSSGADYVPTKVLVDNYQMANGDSINNPLSGFDPNNPYAKRDPRLKYSVFVPGDTLPNGSVYNPLPNSGTSDAIGSTFLATTTGFNLKKYINKEDLAVPTNCGINIILMRYAEVLLMYAEAKIELNQIDQSVYDAINKVRKRPDVNMPAIISGPFSQTQLRGIIRKERAVELAFEGLRFYDLRRWRTADAVLQGPVFGITYNKNGTLTTIQVPFQKGFNSSRDYLWPIPQNEIILNPNLIQNKGW